MICVNVQDNAALHEQITRLDRSNKSLTEQVEYLRSQLEDLVARKHGRSAPGSFM